MQSQKRLADELRFATEFHTLLDVMQQVAISKLRRTDERVGKDRSLVEVLRREFLPLVPAAAAQHPLLRGGARGQLVVVYTSDEGMVGSLHAAVARQALEKADGETHWCFVGQRGARLLSAQAAEARIIPAPSDDDAHQQLRTLSQAILSQYLTAGLKAAWLVAPRYLSPVRQDVATYPLLPLPVVPARADVFGEFITEPTLQRVLQRLAAVWVEQVCLEAFWSARRAECACRALHVEDSRQELAKRSRLVRFLLFKAVHERVNVLVRETSVVQRFSAKRRAAASR